MPDYALVKNGIVDNIVVCENDDFANDFFSEFTVVNIKDVAAAPEWSYDGKSFTAPVTEKTPEKISEENLETANSEYSRAGRQIDAINEQIEDEDWDGTAEGQVRSELSKWTYYRKKLRRYIKKSDGSVDLPSCE